MRIGIYFLILTVFVECSLAAPADDARALIPSLVQVSGAGNIAGGASYNCVANVNSTTLAVLNQTCTISYTATISDQPVVFSAIVLDNVSKKTLSANGNQTGCATIANINICNANLAFNKNYTTGAVPSVTSFSMAFQLSITETPVFFALSSVLPTGSISASFGFIYNATLKDYVWKFMFNSSFSMSGSPISSGSLQASSSFTANGTAPWSLTGSASFVVTVGTPLPEFSVQFSYDSASKIFMLEGSIGNTVDLGGGFQLAAASIIAIVNLTSSTTLNSLEIAGTFSANGDLAQLGSIFRGTTTFRLTATYTSSAWKLTGSVNVGFPAPITDSTLTVSCTRNQYGFVFGGQLAIGATVGGTPVSFTASMTYNATSKILGFVSSTKDINLGGGFSISGAALNATLNLTSSVTIKSLTFTGSFSASGDLSALSSVLKEATFQLTANYTASAWTLTGSVTVTFSGPIRDSTLAVFCTYQTSGFVFGGSLSITVDIGATAATFLVGLTFTPSTQNLVLTASALGDIDVIGGISIKAITVTVVFKLSAIPPLQTLTVSGTFALTPGGALSFLKPFLGSLDFTATARYTQLSLTASMWTIEGSTTLTFTGCPVHNATITLACSFTSTGTVVFNASASLFVEIGGDVPEFFVWIAYMPPELRIEGGMNGCVNLVGGFQMCNVALGVGIIPPMVFTYLHLKGTLKFTSGGAQVLGGFLSAATLSAELLMSKTLTGGYNSLIELAITMNMDSSIIIAASGFIRIELKIPGPADTPGPQFLPTASLNFSLTAKLGSDPSNYPTFFAYCSFSFATMGFDLGAGMTGLWRNPFGISGLEIKDVSLRISYAFSILMKFECEGNVTFGTGAHQKRVFVYVAINTLNPASNAIIGMLNGTLSFFSIVNFAMTMAASSSGISIPDITVGFDMTVSNLLFKLCSRTIVVNNITFTAGLAIEGSLNFLGMSMFVSFELTMTGVRAFFEMTPIDIGGLLVVRRSQNEPGLGPLANLTATWAPLRIEVNCSAYVSVFSSGNSVVLSISPTRFFFEMKNLKFLLLFNADLTFEAVMGSSLANAVFTVTAEMTSDLFASVNRAAQTAIQTYANDATANIKAAQDKVNEQTSKVQNAQNTLDNQKAEVAREKAKVDKAQDDVNKMCSIQSCGTVCSPTSDWSSCARRTKKTKAPCAGNPTKTCTYGNDCIPDWVVNPCGKRVTDPVCVGINESCEKTRSSLNGVLTAAKNSFNVANGAISGLEYSLNLAKDALTLANNALSLANTVNAAGAAAASKMASFLTGGVFDLTRVYFRATVSIANGGNIASEVSVSWLGGAVRMYNLTVNFKDIAQFANTVWTAVKSSLSMEYAQSDLDFDLSEILV